jgi:hypothetical protein
MATPMQLLGVLELGGSETAGERAGAIFALALAFCFAVLLAVLGAGAGERLRARGYRHVLEAEDPDAHERNGRPKSASASIDDGVIVAALVAGTLALVAAGVIRQAAVSLLAGSGESAVAISWPIFLALTLALFVAVGALAFWQARPLAGAHAQLDRAVGEADERVTATRRASLRHAAAIEACRVRLEAITACSHKAQLAQLQLGAEEIALRRLANQHLHGVTVEPETVQRFVEHPEQLVRPLVVPGAVTGMQQRIEAVRRLGAPAATQPEGAA